MGLDTDFGCWNGGYIAFHWWRTEVAKCIGIKLESMQGFTDNGEEWPGIDPLEKLLNRSDCDGKIKWKDCLPIARRLQAISPNMPPNLKPRTNSFISGLISAHISKKSVGFH